jgi:hypothetical protein
LSAEITLRVLTSDVRVLAQALADALETLGDADAHTQSYGQTALAWVRVRQGPMRDGCERFEPAIAHFRALGDVFGLFWSLRGYTLALSGEHRADDSRRAVGRGRADQRYAKDLAPFASPPAR